MAVNADAPLFGVRANAAWATVENPHCDGTVDVKLHNGTPRPVTFDVAGDGKVALSPRVVVSPRKRVKTVSHVMTKPTEVITVDGLGHQLTTRKIGKPDPCLVEKRVDWGTPATQDDFSGTLNLSDWYVYASPDAKHYPRTPEAVTVRDGLLRIAGGVYNVPGGQRDVSGGVSHQFGQKYGKWEVRLRADRGEGYSPVVLLWPDTEKWPDDGEVDVIEAPPTDRQSGASFLHNGQNDDKIQRKEYFDWTQWHVVSVEWLPDRVTVAVDGVDQWHVFDPKYIPSTSSMHLTLQNDQGAEFSAPRTPSTPARVTMYVDWIKVYRVPS